MDRVGLGLGLASAEVDGEVVGEADGEATSVGDDVMGEGDADVGDGEESDGDAEGDADGLAVTTSLGDGARVRDGPLPAVPWVQAARSPAHTSAVVARRARLTSSG